MDPALFSRFKIGYCSENIRESMPRDGEMLGKIKRLKALLTGMQITWLGMMAVNLRIIMLIRMEKWRKKPDIKENHRWNSPARFNISSARRLWVSIRVCMSVFDRPFVILILPLMMR